MKTVQQLFSLCLLWRPATKVNAFCSLSTESKITCAFPLLSSRLMVSIEPKATIVTNRTVTYPPVPVPFSAGLGLLFNSACGRGHKYMELLRRKFGDAYVIWDKYVVLADPDAIQDVLEKYNLPKTPQVRKGYRFMFGRTGSILAAPWGPWQKQRRMTGPLFTAPAVRNLSGILKESIDPFFQVVDNNAETGRCIDMDRLFTSVTMDIIGGVILNRTFGMCESALSEGESSSQFVDSTTLIMAESLRQMVFPAFVLKLRPKFMMRKINQARANVNKFLDDCIITREGEQKHSSDYTDLLQVLLNAERCGEISRDQVKAQLYTFLFAGHETTAHTLSYMLWEISQNRTLQELLAGEVQKILPRLYDNITHNPVEMAERLPLLDNTLSETLRKHPVTATGTSRYVGADPVIVGNGLELPKAASISIPPWSIHRNEKYWRDPEKFDPSRFEQPITHPFAYQPFSGGPRNCIGTRLARAESLYIMAPLLRRYIISCDEKSEPDDFMSLTRRPRHGIHFRFKRRNR